jgi:excisionase family DNA binding protein
MPHDPYDLSVGDVAKLLRVHYDSVVRWADDGVIPCFRTPGKHRRFRRSDIDRFLLERTTIQPEDVA